jgi:hypothetical protein
VVAVYPSVVSIQFGQMGSFTPRAKLVAKLDAKMEKPDNELKGKRQ